MCCPKETGRKKEGTRAVSKAAIQERRMVVFNTGNIEHPDPEVAIIRMKMDEDPAKNVLFFN